MNSHEFLRDWFLSQKAFITTCLDVQRANVWHSTARGPWDKIQQPDLSGVPSCRIVEVLPMPANTRIVIGSLQNTRYWNLSPNNEGIVTVIAAGHHTLQTEDGVICDPTVGQVFSLIHEAESALARISRNGRMIESVTVVDQQKGVYAFIGTKAEAQRYGLIYSFS